MSNDKKFEVAGNISIVSTGKTTSVDKEEFEKVLDGGEASTVDPGMGSSLVDMYDRYSKLLYVIDSSVSMASGMLTDESVKQYTWTPELLQEFRDRMKDAYQEDLDEWKDWCKDERADLRDQGLDADEIREALDEQKPEDPSSMDDESLKKAIVFEDLATKFNIGLQRNYSFRARSRSKMTAVKDAAKKFVNERFRKFQDARVGVFKFSDHPTLLCAAGASEAEVMEAINRLPEGGDGGTAIFEAVSRAVNECKKRPSEVGLHHIVFVSDGEDYSGTEVIDLLPKMKDLGIVFDFIYIIGSSGTGASESIAKVLREVCSATGGEYTEVKTEQDFEQKFLAASNRPLLPPCR